MPKNKYTLEEEIGNTATHAFGSLVAAFLLGFLIYHGIVIQKTLTDLIGYGIFGFSSVMMFIMSSLYHAISVNDIKLKLKLFDHIAIYFLIAGTYIPVTLCSIIEHNPILGWSFIGIQISAVIAGVCYKLFSKKNFGMLSTTIYCIIGWSAVMIFKPLMDNLNHDAMVWLVAGGFAYTIGVPFYVLKQYKWTHTIWHGFVIIGVICHYMMLFDL